MKRFILYLLRWQLSTPILALCLKFLSFNTIINTIIANLIGGMIFFEIDKYIFKGGKNEWRNTKINKNTRNNK